MLSQQVHLSEAETGPQQTLLLMEIGDDPTAVDAEGLDPQIARIIGMTGGALGDDSVRMADKVLTLTVALLKEQLDKFAVRYPKSGPNSLKQNPQVILTDHLQENEVFVHVGGREGGGGVRKRGDEELFLEGCVSIKTKVVSVIICCLLGAPRFFPRGHGT